MQFLLQTEYFSSNSINAKFFQCTNINAYKNHRIVGYIAGDKTMLRNKIRDSTRATNRLIDLWYCERSKVNLSVR